MDRAWSVALAGKRYTCPLQRRQLRSRLRPRSLRGVAGGSSAATVAAARSFTRGLFTSGVLLMQEGAPGDEARGGKAAAARRRRPTVEEEASYRRPWHDFEHSRSLLLSGA